MISLLLWMTLAATPGAVEVSAPDTSRGDAMIAEYFHSETEKLADACLADIHSLEDWTGRREEHRRQLLEMLGLDPLPERTPLHPAITGQVEHDEFRVEKLHFQSRSGLYVSGNLYIPKHLDGPAPAILYVCGHGASRKDGVSFGNKATYQHHGAWFARNGYVCLVIDTLQLGEIEGIHHGTYREGMWWWNARGYTPAGVEAWNCVRALDYLQSRPEVDAERIGVTGRSGGGAYSWWIAAIDDRIKVAVPVAGITNLHNHVVDGCVERHCDCMFMVNTYRWDYAQVAALVAPRPLLISNTDKDDIFPLDGVVEVYTQVRGIYQLYGEEDKLGLSIAEGPHKDSQNLQVHAFNWFNRHLKGEEPPIEMAAEKLFAPEELKVFDELPADEQNTSIHENFVAQAAAPEVPESAEAWQRQRDQWLAALEEKCFRGWPAMSQDPEVEHVFTAQDGDLQLSAFDFTSQEHIPLRLYMMHAAGVAPEEFDHIELQTLDEEHWQSFLATIGVGFAEQLGAPDMLDDERYAELADTLREANWAAAFVAPRGIGPAAWNPSQRNQTHVRRRFMLLGQTLDGMRVWDVRRAVQALQSITGNPDLHLRLRGEGAMAGIALYAAIFEPGVKQLALRALPASHRDGPDFLNVLRVLDVPQAVALAAENARVRIDEAEPADWSYPLGVSERLGWDEEHIEIRAGDQPNSRCCSSR